MSTDISVKIAQALPQLRDTSAWLPIIPTELRTAPHLSDRTRSIKTEVATTVWDNLHHHKHNTSNTNKWKSAKIKSTTKITIKAWISSIHLANNRYIIVRDVNQWHRLWCDNGKKSPWKAMWILLMDAKQTIRLPVLDLSNSTLKMSLNKTCNWSKMRM